MDNDRRHIDSPGLQRKLFLALGPLLALMLVTAIVAIVLLQSVLTDMSEVERRVAETGHTMSAIAARISAVHVQSESSDAGGVDQLRRDLGRFKLLAMRIEELDPRTGQAHDASHAAIGRLIATADAEIAAGRGASQSASLLNACDTIGHEMLLLAAGLHDDLLGTQDRLVGRFRWIVVGLTLAFIFLVNISIFVLLRTARLILRPVHDLVEASHRLAREDFACRVTLQGRDEFDELANAFNELAEQLQEGERRRIETLHQVARAVNHELNNALSILELQLKMIERRPDSPVPASQLRQIHETLERMSGTVRALANVRRIVLTDYLPGTLMLDLQRSSGTLEESEERRIAIESE